MTPWESKQKWTQLKPQTKSVFGNERNGAKYRQPISAQEIDRMLLGRAEVYLRRWLPEGRIVGNEYLALNPRRADKHLGSFRINLKTGVWKEFAGGPGGKGLLSLYKYVKNIDFKEAVDSLKLELGVESASYANEQAFIALKKPIVKPVLNTKIKTTTDAGRILPLSLAEFAESKKLPPDFLEKNFRVYEDKGRLIMPYFDAEMQQVRLRIRATEVTPDGARRKWVRWSSGNGKEIIPYGIWLLPKNDFENLFMVEGETDTWTLHYHGFTAIGFPGASSVASTIGRTSYNWNRAKRILVVREPDEGGTTFVRLAEKALRERGYWGEIVAISLNDKDPSDLHVRCVEHGLSFEREMSRCIIEAQTLDNVKITLRIKTITALEIIAIAGAHPHLRQTIMAYRIPERLTERCLAEAVRDAVAGVKIDSLGIPRGLMPAYEALASSETISRADFAAELLRQLKRRLDLQDDIRRRTELNKFCEDDPLGAGNDAAKLYAVSLLRGL